MIMKKIFVSAIVAAGGSGTRMNKEKNKLFLPVLNTPVIAHTLLALEKNDCIDEIIISAKESEFFIIDDIIKEFGILKVKSIVKGGQTRAESVMSAINEISENSDFVAVHDGARPLVSQAVLNNTVKDAEQFGAAACGVLPKCTLKSADGDGFIKDTVDRSKTYEIQTPQVFKKDLFLKAYSQDMETIKNATDDCSLIEKLGVKIKISEGDYKNIKITTPEDILIAEAILKDGE